MIIFPNGKEEIEKELINLWTGDITPVHSLPHITLNNSQLQFQNGKQPFAWVN